MLIAKVSIIDGKERVMDLPVTIEQIEAYENGALAQRAFPNLTADQREFIISGIVPEEWDKIFGKEEPE